MAAVPNAGLGQTRRVVAAAPQGQPQVRFAGQPQIIAAPGAQPVRYVVQQQNGGYAPDLKVASRSLVTPAGAGIQYKVASQNQVMPGMVAGQYKVASQQMMGQPQLQGSSVKVPPGGAAGGVRFAPQQLMQPGGGMQRMTLQANGHGGYTYRPANGTVQPLKVPAVNRSTSSPSAAAPPVKSASASLNSQHFIQLAEQLLGDEHREKLKAMVVECFRAADAQKREELNLRDLYTFKGLFTAKSGVPDSLFKDMHTDYVRFDFNGSGLLSMNETYKLVKFYLYAALRKAGVGSASVGVPITSLSAAGYSNLVEVGKGSQGTVYFCSTASGSEKCVKSYRKDMVSISGLAEIHEEYEAMKLCACDRVAAAFEIFQDAQFYYMVGEAYHGGDFVSLKVRSLEAGVVMDETWWRKVFRQCFEGIVFMHEQAMMHCDIKEPNLMFRTSNFHQPEVVIIDLGLSKATVGKARTGGTPGYIPPETLDRNIWFPKGDVFSMGVCVIQILTDKIPPTGARTTATPGGIFVEGCRTVEDIAHATRTRTPPFEQMPEEWPDLRKLTIRLLQKDFRVRPTAQQALEDPWFTKEFRSRTRTGFTSDIGARNRFATDGITASVLMRLEREEDDDEGES